MIVCLLRLVVRTSGFHPDNSSSILLGDVNKNAHLMVSVFVLRVFCLLAKGLAFFAAQKTAKTLRTEFNLLAKGLAFFAAQKPGKTRV